MPSHPESAYLHWDFPLPRPHTGILLGNGWQGLMIWGVDALCLTVARAGFWDHRGGRKVAAQATYQEVRRLLEAGDEAGLRQLFSGPAPIPGQPQRPRQIGGGRLEIRFPDHYRPVRARLHVTEGWVEVILAAPHGGVETLVIDQARGVEIAWLEIPSTLRCEIALQPAWDFLEMEMRATGMAAPTRWQTSNEGGFAQSLPEDEALAVAWWRNDGFLLLATALGPDAAATAQASLRKAEVDYLRRSARRWWKEYWQGIPQLRLPDSVLRELYLYGVYKQAGLTTPETVPATLQGPWMEEYQFPPWSNDYHFNINVQMIYWPALGTGRWSHFRPLWQMLAGWLPLLRDYGARFFQHPEALLLPHAVDDHGSVIGNFWTGTIDHACTAWMGQLAWLYYRYSNDRECLRELAWPLLTGAFAGFWSMLESSEGRLSLPVSVSPEFKGARMDAWGRNASFQLAACHMLVRILPEAARILQQPIDARWQQVAEQLPPYCTVTAPRTREHPEHLDTRIALWEGMDLLESHRHHSHLAGLYPFATIDPAATTHSAIVEASVFHWTRTGAGAWSGWSFPWAAILHARLGRPDAAIHWLHTGRRVFFNEGRGSLHDPSFPGVSTILTAPPEPGKNREIMQMDASLGAVTAILELLVQCRPDGIHLLPAIPQGWRDFGFQGIYAEGGFRFDANVSGGHVQEIRVEALHNGELVLHHGLGEKYFVNGRERTGSVCRQSLLQGDLLLLRRNDPLES